jgi:hypothetical protein
MSRAPHECAWRRPAIAAAAFALVAGVWLNQSVSRAEWERVRDRVFAAPGEHLLEAVHYPFVFLYRRSHDEEIYYATASALLGRPFPPAFLDRGEVPGAYRAPSSTTDGRVRVPYVEVPLEYPPTALPFIVLPRLVASSYQVYAQAFDALMAACLAAACALAIRVVSPADDAGRARRWWLGTAVLLAHGAIAVQRLDAVVALLMALALRAAVRRRPGQLGAWIGLAAATKIVPGLLLPIVVACDRDLLRPKKLAWLVGSAAVACGLGLAPLLLSGHFADFLAYHGQRGLHVESLLGSLYGVACAMRGRPADALLDFGSFNFHGAVPDALAVATPWVTLAAIAAVTWFVWRAPANDADGASPGRWSAALLAGMAVLWLGGKVFSPQYLTWAIPLVLAVPGERVVRSPIALSFVAALVLGQLYLRGYYDHVYGQRPLGLGTLIVRQATVVALFVWALRAVRRRETNGEGQEAVGGVRAGR